MEGEGAREKRPTEERSERQSAVRTALEISLVSCGMAEVSSRYVSVSLSLSVFSFVSLSLSLSVKCALVYPRKGSLSRNGRGKTNRENGSAQ